ncbi:glycosyltransferase family 4 protein [Acinetobacter faecalis]|uniref:glycosyltransferase family 4 protein n=1 Tax=Acinetobacter faecalis TaxID=2665161 RepID=UPI002A90AB6B|nr:glycosyltransferase family 1 protein [Acinetobacter faecalis]MDY6462187.1 glycosyltransferase family 1 protein [Acinetobacter faecalis]
MKIKFDSTIFELQKYGGISRYFYELSNELFALDNNDTVDIVAPLYINEYIKDSDLVKGFYLDNNKRKIYRKSLKLYSEWSYYLSNVVSNYDINHITYYKSGLLEKSKAKNIITVYDMIHELYADEFSSGGDIRAEKLTSINQVDHIICISENTKLDLMSILNIPESKISVTYLGVRSNNLDVNDVDIISEDYLLYVGNRGGYKNFGRFIQAYAINKKIKNKIKIYVFGGGSFSNTERELFSSLNIYENMVKHVGSDDAILNYLYKNAVAFVFPSLYEGFGMPPLEAMVQGCPVVVSNSSSIPEVVGSAGIYFDPLSVEDISEALTKVVFDDSLRESIIEKGYERIKLFTWKKCAIETRKIYESLL